MVSCQFEEAGLDKVQNRSIVPFILIAIGVLFLVGAVISVLLIRAPEGPSNSDAGDTAGNDLQVTRVDLLQAKAAYDDGSAVFIDVRDKAYYDNGHIPGAKSIPLGEIEERHGELNRHDWIILYCT